MILPRTYQQGSGHQGRIVDRAGTSFFLVPFPDIVEPALAKLVPLGGA